MSNRFVCPMCGASDFTVWATETGVYNLLTNGEHAVEESAANQLDWDQKEGWGFHAIFAAWCNSCGQDVGAALAESVGVVFQPEAMAQYEAQL